MGTADYKAAAASLNQFNEWLYPIRKKAGQASREELFHEAFVVKLKNGMEKLQKAVINASVSFKQFGIVAPNPMNDSVFIPKAD